MIRDCPLFIGMVKISAKVTMRLGGSRELQRVLKAGASDADVREMYEEWAADYKEFLRQRYARLSQGGGEWPPISQKTAEARARRGTTKRRRSAAGRFVAALNSLIMIDTRETYESLLPGVTRGWTQRFDFYGVTVGFAGSAMHRSGKATIAEIVAFHQNPGPRAGYPQRKVVVPAGPELDSKFRAAAVKLITKLKKRAAAANAK